MRFSCLKIQASNQDPLRCRKICMKNRIKKAALSAAAFSA
jgi:hypothetical protein